MNDRYLFKAKRKNWKELPKEEWWVQGYYVKKDGVSYIYGKDKRDQPQEIYKIDKSTLCKYTDRRDKNRMLIWENDILMCNNNPKDLVKAVFGEFSVIDADSLETVDRVVGWHYEVVPTDEVSKCEPFCLSMPLTDFYIDMCDMRVVGSIFDNPELLEVKQ